ncbi:hypothetical protein OfM1_05730 [Lactovum odontotermitis]
MKIFGKLLIAAAGFAAAAGIELSANADVAMNRLYNPNSGEHFYTATPNEASSLVDAGWSYEGIGWVAPDSGSPVYRLYNKNAGDHFYTLSSYERDELKKAGWSDEGIGWYSGGSVALKRAYNPNAKAGSHNYTTSPAEQANLIKAGWKDEAVAWYGTEEGASVVEADSDSDMPYYFVSKGWNIAAFGNVFVDNESGLAYTRVKNAADYDYVPWDDQDAGDDTASALFLDEDLEDWED